MHKARLDEGNLDGRLVDIVFAQLGKVEVVRVSLLLLLLNEAAAAVHHSRESGALDFGARGSHEIVLFAHFTTDF